MLSIISPAKSLDFAANINGLQATNPIFKSDTAVLANLLKSFSQAGIKQLMHVSDNLAELNFSRYQSFADNNKTAKAAISVFKGDVYRY